MSTRQWYRIQNAADAGTVDIFVNDFIGDWIDDYWGFGVTAKAFLDQLAALPDTTRAIRVHLNSPGGDVFAATTIANALREQRMTKGRTVETIVDGLAASAATIIMMAGDPVKVADNAVVMIHNPWSVAMGNAAQMRKFADDLDTIRDTIVATYQWHSKLDAKDLIELMDAETWMSAEDALTYGLATEIVTGLKAAAALAPKAIEKLTIPDQFRDRVAAFLGEQVPAERAPLPVAELVNDAAMKRPSASAVEVLQVCREGDCLDLAEGFLSANASLETVRAGVQAAKDAKAAAQQRRATIESICAAARQPELAAVFVSGGMTPDAARQALTIITAKLDKVEIDGNLAPHQHGPNTARAIDRKAIYARLNQPQPRA